jgi:hypothetical protein
LDLMKGHSFFSDGKAAGVRLFGSEWLDDQMFC